MTTRRLLALAGLVALFVAYAIAAGGSDTNAVETDSATDTTAAAVLDDDRSDIGASDSSGAATFVTFSDLPPITLADLPVEALDTLSLIERGGPYPFDRDDLVFQNREGLLPDRARGHYREYTVITPGEDDRGARRIVSGADGERYYTADHYRSFTEVVFD
ncbi:MAG: ribonuclease domain-containing protein [Actinomycetota bacterium]